MRIQNHVRAFIKGFSFSAELLLLILFFVTLPLKNSYNSISILLILIFAFSKFQKFNIKRVLNFPVLLSYFILYVVSLAYTTDVSSGLESLLRHSVFLIFPMLFSSLNFKKSNINTALNYFIVWICLLAFYSEIATIWKLLVNDQSLFLWFRKDFSYKALGSIIGIHPPYMSLFTSYCVLLLIDKIGDNKKRNFVYIITILFLFFYTIHLSSRLPIVALLLVSTVFYFKKLLVHNSLSKAFFKLFILIGIVFTLLLSVRSTRYRFAEVFGMKYSSGLYIKSGPDKLEQWAAAIDANENVLFGNGLGDVNESLIASNKRHGLMKNANRKYNAHNQYIQTYVGLGIIGLILLFGIFLYSWDTKKPLFKLNNYFLIYLSIVFLSESYLQRHHGIVFIVFILCVIQQQKAGNKTLGTD
jgi:O-antigen ligase